MLAESWTISDLVAQLERDPWRQFECPFTADMAACHKVLFDPATTRGEMALSIQEWLASGQPCLFGRMEARQNRLAVCILNENDLERSDQHIRHRIEQERNRWKNSAALGASHGFLIVAVSERIALARSTPALRDLAARLCELYIGKNEFDVIYHDDLILQIPGDDGAVEFRRWKVGINYFAAQADGRWWRDHRIPGGMAFSMNSVGHMARTKVESELTKNPSLRDRLPPHSREKLVYWALPTAMKTIGPPFDGSTRGTWLAERGRFPEDREPPTFEQRRRCFEGLANYSENRYHGRYHTDETLPTCYFRDELWKLEEIGVRDDLYFNYLHDESEIDYETMGAGVLPPFEQDDASESMKPGSSHD